MVTLPELNLFLVREVLLDMKSSERLGQLVRIYVTSHLVPVEDVDTSITSTTSSTG